jgi:hypothetical protein
LYVGARMDNIFFSEPLTFCIRERIPCTSQVSASVWGLCHSPGQSVLAPSRHQRAKEKSTVEFRFLLPWNLKLSKEFFVWSSENVALLSVTPKLNVFFTECKDMYTN